MSGKALPFRMAGSFFLEALPPHGGGAALEYFSTSTERQSLSAHRRAKPVLYSMENTEEVLQEFGKRIQRCYGCFIAYHLKDMYLGEDVTFFCEHCKDDNMFHFDEFA